MLEEFGGSAAGGCAAYHMYLISRGAALRLLINSKAYSQVATLPQACRGSSRRAACRMIAALQMLALCHTCFVTAAAPAASLLQHKHFQPMDTYANTAVQLNRTPTCTAQQE
jgi:hypothetical protein